MDVGVVIGRFQVESLHEGHRYLINQAFQNHRKVIIFVGVPPIEGTKHDPLDYPTRLRMLQSEYPDAIVLPLRDRRSDDVWSQQLDEQIETVVPNVRNAVLYGGRDSFQQHYFGHFKAVEIDGGINYRNSSEQRADIGKVVRNSADFRAGIIYSTQNAWPYCKACVDIALVREQHNDIDGTDETEIALVRKQHEGGKWRLPGGMVEKGETLEQAAARELREETAIACEIGDFQYVTNMPVGDWRFKKAGEIGLLTTLFCVPHMFGALQAGSDVSDGRWVRLADAGRQVIRAHRPLIEAVQARLVPGTTVASSSVKMTIGGAP